MTNPYRWPFGRYTFRGLLAKLEPQVLVLAHERGNPPYVVQLDYTVPDRVTGEPVRLSEKTLSYLRNEGELDRDVYWLLASVLGHEVDEGLVVTGTLYLEAHPAELKPAAPVIRDWVDDEYERRESDPDPAWKCACGNRVMGARCTVCGFPPPGRTRGTAR